MRLLLDTHALIWYISADPLISTMAANAIRNSKNDCFFSIASLWEMAIKEGLGKLNFNVPIAKLQQKLAADKIEILQISIEHAQGVKALPHHHRDPFDRMLISQAIFEGLTIVTADTEIPKYNVGVLW